VRNEARLDSPPRCIATYGRTRASTSPRVEVTLVLADGETRLEEGGYGFAAAGAPHTFRLDSADARLLLLITPGAAGHEGMFAEMGEPATANELPVPPEGPPDFASLAAIAAKHGTTILGPPPGPSS
jgi:hypothetical protein